MADDQSDIIVETGGDNIAILRLNRPSVLNALTRETVALLNRRLEAIAADNSIRVLVLTGVGRGFCAGQDVGVAKTRGDRTGNRTAERMLWQDHYSGIVRRLVDMPQIVIAAINGPAAGVGMAITLGADIRIMARSAKLLVASIRLGLTGGESGMSYLLPRLIGASRAFEILLTGRAVTADEALAIGLAAYVVDDEGCEAKAIDVAGQILANSPFGTAYTKRMMWDNLDSNFRTGMRYENSVQILSSLTDDYKEALNAFSEKRPGKFTGN